MSQASLWDAPAKASQADTLHGASTGISLYGYQQAAVARIGECLRDARSTLVVLPTGTGKTRTAAAFVQGWDGPVTWVAHREELIDQGRATLRDLLGEDVATEKAEQRAWAGARLVVASVQSLKGDRLKFFGKTHKPTLIVVDEAHHAVSPSYRAILDAFPEAKVLGLTATPDRSDERAMGQVFDSVATVYEIRDAIRDGYLCGIRLLSVKVDAIDLAGVATVAGDLNQGQLDAVMNVEKVIHGIVKPTIELAGARRTIMFTTSVENAHRMAEVFNRYRPGSARAVDGGTPTDERRHILAGHKRGDYQYLCNVGVLTEGYDDPGIACIGMARPTKSRALYAQCAGRGLRIHPGKLDCLLLDFVGNAGRHALVSGLDILDGKWDEETVAKAREIVEESPDGIDPEAALEEAARRIAEARAREAAKRARLTAKVSKRVTEVDPFGVFHMERGGDADEERFGVAPSEKQLAYLSGKGVEIATIKTRAQASRLIGNMFKRKDLGLCTYKQLKQLQRFGITDVNVGFQQATRVLGYCFTNGRAPTPAQLDALLVRAPGGGRRLTAGAYIDARRVCHEVSLLPLLPNPPAPKRVGANAWKALCPFHAEKTPSLSVRYTARGWGFYCFGCQEHGSVIDYVQRTERIGFREACARLGATPTEGPPVRLYRRAERLMYCSGPRCTARLETDAKDIPYIGHTAHPGWALTDDGRVYCFRCRLDAWARAHGFGRAA